MFIVDFPDKYYQSAKCVPCVPSFPQFLKTMFIFDFGAVCGFACNMHTILGLIFFFYILNIAIVQLYFQI